MGCLTCATHLFLCLLSSSPAPRSSLCLRPCAACVQLSPPHSTSRAGLQLSPPALECLLLSFPSLFFPFSSPSLPSLFPLPFLLLPASLPFFLEPEFALVIRFFSAHKPPSAPARLPHSCFLSPASPHCHVHSIPVGPGDSYPFITASQTQPLHTPPEHLEKENHCSHAVSRGRSYLIVFLYKARHVASTSLCS